MRVTFERGEEDLYDMVRLKACTWAYSCETSKTLLLTLFLFRLRSYLLPTYVTQI